MIDKKLKQGVIISIQGYSKHTTQELAVEAVKGGAVALRMDKPVSLSDALRVPFIGLAKSQVKKPENEAYITSTVEAVQAVAKWADIVAIDYRRLNKNIKEISAYCQEHKLLVVADIRTIEDAVYIVKEKLYYTYMATTLAVFNKKLKYKPDTKLVKELVDLGIPVIAEGNFTQRREVREAFDLGARCVCLGGAVSNIYKLTRKFASVLEQ
jgi:N-acylglucosamine-6-phosphate 2-epimerase